MNVMRLKPQGYLLKTMSRKDIIASIDDFLKTENGTIGCNTDLN